MPITLPPLSRRRFLAGAVGAGAGLLLSRFAIAQTQPVVDANRIVLISDLHIDANPAAINRETNMADNLARVVKEIAALDPRPAAVLVNGDCAHSVGTAGDYATLVELLKPIRQAGIAVHLSMGNHDNRENFWKAIPNADQPAKLVPDRQVSVIQTPLADWYMLDSLIKTSTTPGAIGEAQLAWLAKSLDAKPDKPAIVLTHHQPDLAPKTNGLTDTKALLDVLSPRKQAKSLIFGHTHAWANVKKPDGMHFVNLPPTAYTFAKGRPAGWVDVTLTDKSTTMVLYCLDDKHAQHRQKLSLDWR